MVSLEQMPDTRIINNPNQVPMKHRAAHRHSYPNIRSTTHEGVPYAPYA